MSRPRKYFFWKSETLNQFEIGQIVSLDMNWPQQFKVVKIHPRKGGITVVKVG